MWRTADHAQLFFPCGEADLIYMCFPFRGPILTGFKPSATRLQRNELREEIDDYQRPMLTTPVVIPAFLPYTSSLLPLLS